MKMQEYTKKRVARATYVIDSQIWETGEWFPCLMVVTIAKVNIVHVRVGFLIS